MKHGIKLRKLNRRGEHRRALLRNLSISLLTHENIVTTLPKAKALRPFVEKIITIAKNAKKVDLHIRRRLIAKIGEITTQKLLDQDFAARFVNRNGGYTSIIKKGFRQGDAAPMALIKLL